MGSHQELTFVANVVAGGQITIPTEVRRALLIMEGTTLQVRVSVVHVKEGKRKVTG